MENVIQNMSDIARKLIVYTLQSIWHYPLFQTDSKIPVYIRNRQNEKSDFVCIEFAIELPIGLPIGLPNWTAY